MYFGALCNGTYLSGLVDSGMTLVVNCAEPLAVTSGELPRSQKTLLNKVFPDHWSFMLG